MKGRPSGRVIGAAMLAGALLEVWSDFGLQGRLFAGGGFIANAGGQPLIIGLVIVSGLLAGLMSLWVATMLTVCYEEAFPLLSRIYLVLATVALGTTLVELATFIAMRDLSDAYINATPSPGSRYDAARVVVAGLRNGLHFSTKTFDGVVLLVFYLLLLRTRAVPVLVAGAGIVAAPLQMIAVSSPLFGRDVDYGLLAPIGIVYLSTAAWFMARGLRPMQGDALQTENKTAWRWGQS